MATGAAEAAAAHSGVFLFTTREEWIQANLTDFARSCEAAYNYGNYDFLKRAFQANCDAFVNYILDHEALANLQADANDAFVLFRMAVKTNAAAVIIINGRAITRSRRGC